MASATRSGLRLDGRPRAASVGVIAVVATKALDVLTTLVGLHATQLVEANPVVLHVVASVGTVPGLLAIGALTVLAVVALVEATVYALSLRFDPSPMGVLAVRVVGYGIPAVFNALVATHNALLIGMA